MRKFWQLVLSYSQNLSESQDPYIKQLKQKLRFFVTAAGVDKCGLEKLSWNIKKNDCIKWSNGL